MSVKPAHVMRLGAQVDVKGILASTKNADRTSGHLTKYLAKSMSSAGGGGPLAVFERRC